MFRDGHWLLKRTLSGGNADLSFVYGKATDIPIVGDWDGASGDGIGVIRGDQWLLRQTPSGGNATTTIGYGVPTDRSVYATGPLPVPEPEPGTSPLRNRIARGEVGYREEAGNCNKYDRGNCVPWCAIFAEWVWREARVSPVFTTDVARGVAAWGQENGVFKPRPPNAVGNPLPGDIVVYGTPGYVTGGHVGIVYAVHDDGTITTIDGNYEHMVAVRSFNPRTAVGGEEDHPISGYVSPPGA
jgi:hypothetical protein